jgi:hypothetical protein
VAGPTKKKKKRPKKSKGTERYVYCPLSNQHHGLFAIEVIEKLDTGNLWVKCTCGVRIHFDNGTLAVMTKRQALEAGAILPFHF